MEMKKEKDTRDIERSRLVHGSRTIPKNVLFHRVGRNRRGKFHQELRRDVRYTRDQSFARGCCPKMTIYGPSRRSLRERASERASEPESMRMRSSRGSDDTLMPIFYFFMKQSQFFTRHFRSFTSLISSLSDSNNRIGE